MHAFYVFILHLTWRIPEKIVNALADNDSGSLFQVTLLAVIGLGLIFLPEWKRKPVGMLYWLAGLLPGIGGIALGVLQYQNALIHLTDGGSFVGRMPEDYLWDGYVTIHYGLTLSMILCGVILCILSGRFVLRLKKRTRLGNSNSADSTV